MAEIKNFMGEKVGNHTIEVVEWLDNTTCIIFFNTENDEEDENVTVVTIVEYWVDDKTWHFRDSFFDSEGMFLENDENESFTDKERERCKEIVNEFIGQFKEK